MNSRQIDEVVHRDVVIVGTGVAGLTAALGMAPRSVALVSKSALGAGGSSAWAQGGVAAALGDDDSPALHAADTLAVGGELGDPEVVEILAREGRQRIRWLVELGTRFDRDRAGRLACGREAAHSRRRVLHAGGDATGAELVRALVEAVAGAPEVSLFEHTTALELAVAGGRVAGVLARGADGRRLLLVARAVVLATGGIGRLYRYTTNPPENTGDGLAMAARAGARLVDLEMVQFHPTALAVAGADPLPLLTEALRGEGAVLLDGAGRRFMLGEHPLAELAPRDVVARAIYRRQQTGQEVFLDARQAVGEAFPQRFPTVFAACREHRLDPRSEPLPVSPAAHYHMGGIAVDRWGRASLAGLWACGEVASTGAHGANRLASNSLLEALVFGGRVASDVRRRLAPPRSDRAALAALPSVVGQGAEHPQAAALTAEARQLMWEKVGLVRDRAGLSAALDRLEVLARRHPGLSGEPASLLTVGRLVATAALARRESRGSHYRSDYPAADPAWQRRLYLVGGEVEPIPAPEVASAMAAAGVRR